MSFGRPHDGGKTPRGQFPPLAKDMAKRSYNRRSDDEIIEDLQARIRDIERRVEAKQRPDTAVLKDIPRLKKSLAKFSQLCMDNGRKDLSNSVLGFLATLEVQAKALPDELRRSLAGS